MTRDIRTMPIELEDGTLVPVLTYDEWCSLIACFVRVAERRSLTAAEKIHRDELGARNWTARVVAEDVLGRDLTLAETIAAVDNVRFRKLRL